MLLPKSSIRIIRTHQWPYALNKWEMFRRSSQFTAALPPQCNAKSCRGQSAWHNRLYLLRTQYTRLCILVFRCKLDSFRSILSCGGLLDMLINGKNKKHFLDMLINAKNKQRFLDTLMDGKNKQHFLVCFSMGRKHSNFCIHLSMGRTRSIFWICLSMGRGSQDLREVTKVRAHQVGSCRTRDQVAH